MYTYAFLYSSEISNFFLKLEVLMNAGLKPNQTVFRQLLPFPFMLYSFREKLRLSKVDFLHSNSMVFITGKWKVPKCPSTRHC